VEFKRYLLGLCEDLSDLLSQEGPDCGIVVEGAQVQAPTEFPIPLGFIVNELITNHQFAELRRESHHRSNP
jgi:two-component sensor histidine kinase